MQSPAPRPLQSPLEHVERAYAGSLSDAGSASVGVGGWRLPALHGAAVAPAVAQHQLRCACARDASASADGEPQGGSHARRDRRRQTAAQAGLWYHLAAQLPFGSRRLDAKLRKARSGRHVRSSSIDGVCIC